jgi:hypothetical protein
MEQWFDEVYAELTAETAQAAERLTAHIARQMTEGVIDTDAAVQLTRLGFKNAALREARAWMVSARREAAVREDREWAEGSVFVASDEANRPKTVTEAKLAKWFSDVGEAEPRVRVYIQMDDGDLAKTRLDTVAVSQDDAYRYFQTDVYGVGDQLVAQIPWDTER